MTPDTPNGRITLAVIGSKLDQLMQSHHDLRIKVDEIRSCVDRMSSIPADVETLQDDVTQLKVDMESTKTQSRILGGINAALAVIAGALGVKL